jgi:hypothetical protein
MNPPLFPNSTPCGIGEVTNSIGNKGVRMKTSFIGVDLSKAVFQIHCRDEKVRTIATKKLSSAAFLKFVKETEPSVFGIEEGNC